MPVPRYLVVRAEGAKPRRPSGGRWGQNSFCPQAVYQRLFEWVVDKINSIMAAKDRDPRHDGKDTVIGVLDIYGFEVLSINRWAAWPWPQGC